MSITRSDNPLESWLRLRNPFAGRAKKVASGLLPPDKRILVLLQDQRKEWQDFEEQKRREVEETIKALEHRFGPRVMTPK